MTSAKDPHGLEALKRRYLQHLDVTNYAATTQYTRDRQLSRFIEWAEARSITRAAEVTKAVLEAYQKHLFHVRRDDGRPLSRKTQNGLMNGVVVFFKWLTKRRYVTQDPGAALEMPRAERNLPQPALTISEVERVLAAVDITDPLGVRDRALLETLYSTGIRRAELAKLALNDIDAERGVVMIRQGKGKKDRVVPIGDRALAWLNKYVEEVRPFFVKEVDEGIVFLTRFGAAMGNAAVTQVGHRAVKAAGIKKRGACHIFRHSAATLMLERGADVRIVQEFLGHSHLSSTQIYTRVSITKLKEVHTRTHPAQLRRRAEGRPRPESAAEDVAENTQNLEGSDNEG